MYGFLRKWFAQHKPATAAALVVAALCTPLTAGAADAPFEIPVILPLTGPASPTGAPEAQTLPALEATIN